MSSERKINWTVSLFIVITTIVGVAGTIALAVYSHISPWTWVLFATLWVFTALSTTAGYHRLFSHGTYKAHWLVRSFFACFGAASFEGSVLEWCSDHRNHHRYTDTDKDPYSIKRGFWYAHMGWLFFLDPDKRDYSNVKDLQDDRIVMWQHRHILKLMIFFGFLAPTLLACCWGDPLGGFFVAGALRIMAVLNATWCINSVAHTFGKAKYLDQSAKDNGFAALLTFGEGYHNFHHKFPKDFRNGIRWFDYDPTKWLILLLKRFGLAKNLVVMHKSKITQYRLRFQLADLKAKLVETRAQLAEQVEAIYQPVYQQLSQKLASIHVLEKKLTQLKLNKKNLNLCAVRYRQQRRIYQACLRRHWRSTNQLLSVWSLLLRNNAICAA